MDDLISRKQAIDACMKYNGYGSVWACIMGDIKQLPSVTIKDTADKIKVTNCNYNHIAEVSKKGDMISRADAIDAMMRLQVEDDEAYGCHIPEGFDGERAKETLEQLPSAEPKQRYTEEELSVFAHGISLSLLSKRSAQHWRYDEDTATEIKFLERLYEKVGADIRGKEV